MLSDSSAPLTTEVVGGNVVDGLRLELAAQVAPGRWRPALKQVAERLKSGTHLEEALQQASSLTPPDMQQLFSQALKTDDPVGLTHEAIRVGHRARAAWREFTVSIVYPISLFVIALLVSLLFDYCVQGFISLEWIEDFGLEGFATLQARLRDQTHAIWGLAIASFWFGLVLITVRFVGPPWAWISVVGGIIVIGKPIRWIALEELLQRYQMFFARGMDTVGATEAVAGSMLASGQAVVARRVARQVGEGMPLGQALAKSLFADRLTRPIVRQLDAESNTPMETKLERSSAILRRITTERCQTLVAILPLFAVLIVGTLILSSLFSYALILQPLVQMITSLA